MGSLLNIFDTNKDTMARKVVTHKKQGGGKCYDMINGMKENGQMYLVQTCLIPDGLEAPRNSLELPIETSCTSCDGRNRPLYTYPVMNEFPEHFYSTEAPMKKLISEEYSRRPKSRQNAPSVVARLMGVDMLPFDGKPVPEPVRVKNRSPEGKTLENEKSRKGLFGHIPYTSSSSAQMTFSSSDRKDDRDPEQWNNHLKSNKPKRREHPQEEELQKFKKEFEAWQAARFKECSKVMDFEGVPSRLIAQENLNKEKMVIYANSKRIMGNERQVESLDLAGKTSSREKSILRHSRSKSELLPDEREEPLYPRGNLLTTDFKRFPLMNSDQKANGVSVPTKIVILRPGPDRLGTSEDSWNSTPSTSGDRGSIEDFLEEVKERLKSELQGNITKRNATVRGGGIETPYREKPSEPRQIARRIAQQVRESVTRDIGMNLLRSESTRSHRSEIQLNGADSPEFINRDTRKLLAERLKNVLKGERRHEVPMVAHHGPRSSTLGHAKIRAEPSGDIVANKISYADCVKNEDIKQSRSFRQEPDDDVMLHKELSPRNLIRSLSAPVSGTSFGKLLLEDRHIVTGAHIRRKHEVVEKVKVNLNKQKKEKFNIKEKVSSFRYSLTLRGKLFRRRIQSMEESNRSEHGMTNDITSGPTVMMNFYDRHENPTEVPPSPASVCSSVNEEYWRPADCFSPTSVSDVTQLEESEVPNAFKEISSNLSELRRQLNKLEGGSSEENLTDEPDEAEMVITDPAQAYIRDLLVSSGLHDGSYHKSLSRWDPLGKPISNQVFEEVEGSYREQTKHDDLGAKDQDGKLNHKILVDLLNEALLGLLRPPANMSPFMKKVIGPVLEPPCGKKLLIHVWDIIRASVYPPADRSYYALDHMVAWDLHSTPWSVLIDEDINAVGRDIEYLVIGDLIDEVVKDLKMRSA